MATATADDDGAAADHRRKQALRKKLLRKRKRRLVAVAAEVPLPPETGSAGSEHEVENEAEEMQRRVAHELWLEREREARASWLARRAAAEAERARREEAERLIKEEWEQQQKAEREEAEKKRLAEAEKKEKQDALLKEVTSGAKNKTPNGGPWKNPEAPASVATIPAPEVCSFFKKTGCCRFGDRCSRFHDRPALSTTLLIPGMYNHFSLDRGHGDKFDSDIALEYDENEFYRDFCDFYNDTLPAFKAVGKVVQFKVCCNMEPHLRGNVYIQYKREADAEKAYCQFNGRWYAGRQLSCCFCSVTKWKPAICGLFHRNRCPKGNSCNFLHVFRNPTNEFRRADQDLEADEYTHHERSSERSQASRGGSYRGGHSPDDRYRRHTDGISVRSSSRRGSGTPPEAAADSSHRNGRHHRHRHLSERHSRTPERSERRSHSSRRSCRERASPTSVRSERSRRSSVSPGGTGGRKDSSARFSGRDSVRSCYSPYGERDLVLRGDSSHRRAHSDRRENASERHGHANGRSPSDRQGDGTRSSAHGRERWEWSSSSSSSSSSDDDGESNASSRATISATKRGESHRRHKRRSKSRHRSQRHHSRTKGHKRHSKTPCRSNSSRARSPSTADVHSEEGSCRRQSPKHRNKRKCEAPLEHPSLGNGDILMQQEDLPRPSLESFIDNSAGDSNGSLPSVAGEPTQMDFDDDADPRFCRTPSTCGGESP